MSGPRPPYWTNVITLLSAFVVTAVLMGLLAAGIIMPAVGATGAAARSTVSLFDSLPEDFAISPLSQQSRVLDAEGGLISTPQDENRIIVPLSAISPWMQKAQIAIEDARFYQHGGVDLRGVTRAAISNFRGGDNTQGASTLTQQYVKITLQEQALREGDKEAAAAAVAKNYTRKLQELKYAINLEKTLTKKQILAGYLNLVYYGDQAYGVEAASQHYFGIPAKKLSISQAATLAGVVQLPGTTDPRNNPKAAQQRRNIVIDRMLALNYITQKQAAAAKATPVRKLLNIKESRATCARSSQPYFCDYVGEYLKNPKLSPHLNVLGKTKPERIRNINRGGLTIQTTLRPNLQSRIKKDLTRKVPIGAQIRTNNPQIKDGKLDVAAAATIVEPGTGKVLAMQQTSQYTGKGAGVTQVNYNVDSAYGGSAGFAIGSTAKMYALVTALQSGMPIKSTINAKFADTKRPAVYYPNEMKDKCNLGGDPKWEVRNDEPIGGTARIPLETATARSVNTAFAALVIQMGGCKVHSTMTKMHLTRGDGNPIQQTISPITLGSDSTSPLTLATSYAILAADGKYCPPNPILSILDNQKKPLKIGKPACQQVISPEVARGVTKLLEGVIEKGTGTGAKLDRGRPAAGKTGTTDGHKQSWFVGYTPQLASAVWVGTPELPQDLDDVRIGGQFYDQVFGGTIAAPLWSEIMSFASLGMQERDFKDPGDKIEFGDLVKIPDVRGRSVSDATKILEDAGFTARVVGQVNDSLAQGLVVSTDPSGRAVKNSDIGLYVSAGPAPPPRSPKPPKTTDPQPDQTTDKPGRPKPGG